MKTNTTTLHTSHLHLQNAADSADNNFHLIRILCAWGVLFAHSYVLSGSKIAIIDPFAYYFNIQMGTFCVMVFFAISGFLIQRSLLRSSSLLSYFKARALRLLPALACVLLLSVFLLGPIISQQPPSLYFTQIDTWSYLLNINLLDKHTQFHLPGVFANLPHPNDVNGSLWTLPIETWMYIIAALCLVAQKIIQRLIPQIQAYLGVLSSISMGVIILLLGHYFLTIQDQKKFEVLLFASTFFMGAVLYSARAWIRLRWWIACLLLLGTPIFDGPLISIFYLPFTITYSILVLAYRPNGAIRRYNHFGDYSYGLYIYAFPIQQTLIYYLQLDFIPLVIASTLITLPFAIASWHYIEQPMLKLKRF